MENSQPKQPKLEAFKTIQKKFSMAGISPKLETQTYPFNEKIFWGFLVHFLAVTLICVEIFNYAKTFSEYTQSIYIASVDVLFIGSLLILILKVEKLFDLINHCDSFLNTGKWRILFNDKKLFSLIICFYLLSNSNYSV